ncbi:Pectate lyase [Ruminococcus sp. YE71]|uniref:pectate lyase family protein n=1 Tax=unclassified Ruminococcus TaxID=2608920 RepID=UPI000891C1EB|nr:MULTISPECIES: GDSL-type esterase/lipase family protein [unclassified Ruminococcus]SDA31282.1 Pectate lyase [Ruminococcus sp. YE78]SFW51218.1 Pectate lyase [Ruminococcus sp. YE71]
MKKVLSLKILAVVCVIVSIVTMLCANTMLPAGAAGISTDYPAVLLRISTYDNARHINISGYDDKSAAVASELKNTLNESWRFDYTGTDSKGSFYRITNMGTGRVLTPDGYNVSEGNPAIIFGNENEKSQYWYVIPVDKDSYGTDLHFKIVNYENTSLALTNSSNKIVLSSYSGKNEQKWLLNAVGEQGFSGYCKDSNGNVKACNIGGTLGKTVEVRNFDELKAACTSTDPCTIVITQNISKTGSYTKDSNGRYRFNDAKIYMQPNKTVTGSYAAHSLYNVYFNTYNNNYGPGHDLIFRNIQISHDKELNNDNIWEFSYGYNFWIDHVDFVGHDKVNGASTNTDDWDKFLNFKGNTDNDNTDFITISDCKFGLHEYGVLLGYPVDTQEAYNAFEGTPHVTIADNFYNKCVTRAPALMRYGYFHSFNNYVVNFDMGYTIYTASKLYAENNYYNGGTGKGSVVNDSVSSSDISSKYPGQYTEEGSTLTGSNYSLTAKTATACSWRPNTNYSYTAKSAADAKSYCEKYSGPQSSASTMTYATLNKSGYPTSTYIVAPSVSMSDPVVTPAISGNLVLDLKTENEAEWSIKSNFAEGDKVFTDRDFTYYSVPDFLKGAELIQTNCDGKNVEGSQAVFTAAGNMTVYVALDSRVENIPNWLKDWQKTPMQMSASNSVIFNVYSRCVRQGETVTLGTNGQSASCINYTVLAARHIGDVNKDGKFNEDDLNNLHRYLVGADTLVDELSADINFDTCLNISDLVDMRRQLDSINNSAAPTMPGNETTPPAETQCEYEPDGFVFSGNVYLVGDSTVCNYEDNYSTSYDRYGWGMKLAEQFSGVNVHNLALSGRSSRSFLTEQNYQTLKNSIGKGDYLFIQFGHNDEKTDESQYPGLGTYTGLDWSNLDNNGKDSQGRYSYEYILMAYYVNLAKNKGAVPVLVTPITRRASDGQANYQQHTPYQQAMIQLGETFDVAVIDMTTLTTQLYTNLYNAGGASETAKLHCYTDTAHTVIDNTHLSNAGASKIASMIAEQTKEIGLSISKKLKS